MEKNCAELAENFSNHIFQKYSGSDEVRLIFDRYDLPCIVPEIGYKN